MQSEVSKCGKIGIYLFSLAVFLLCAEGYEYNISSICVEERCMTSENMTFNLTLHNFGYKEIELLRIEVVDMSNAEAVATLNRSIIVQPLVPKTVFPNALMPGFPGEFRYKLCFVQKVPFSEQLLRGIFQGETRTWCEKETHSLNVVRCVKDEHCSELHVCKNYTCERISCEGCAYVTNHTCINHECCQPWDCELGKTCREHSCIELECGEFEMLGNHSCITCKEDEIVIEGECVRFSCMEIEYIYNHTCMRLRCQEDEYARNHSCVKLECIENEFPLKGRCVPLQCQTFEFAKNHACVPLNCSFYEIPSNHTCKRDKILLQSLAAEGIAWIFIIFISTLIVHKFMERRSRQRILRESMK